MLQKAVVAVVGPLHHISGNRLVGHNQRAAGLGNFAHLAVEVLDGSRSVLTEHQATDAVLRGVASAVVILHVVLRVVGIVDARQPVIIVIVSDELAFLGKVAVCLASTLPSASYVKVVMPLAGWFTSVRRSPMFK